MKRSLLVLAAPRSAVAEVVVVRRLPVTSLTMTFSDYHDLIKKSVCETGFDGFLPSLCTVDGDDITMKVLDGELSEQGDEEVAMSWAEQFMRDGRTVFVAYRSGRSTVAIVEIVGFDATRKHTLRLTPNSFEEPNVA